MYTVSLSEQQNQAPAFHLGIMVDYRTKLDPPFFEKGFYACISRQGHKQGIPVTVFSPTSIHWQQQVIDGYRYQHKRWNQGYYPLPTHVYDRIFYRGSKQIRHFKPFIECLHKEHKVTFLGRGLPGKWKVYQMLNKNKRLHEYLVPTWSFSDSTLRAKLNTYGALCVKPSSGSHGKGVMKVSVENALLKVRGRDLSNRSFTRAFHEKQKGMNWLAHRCNQRIYIIQPFLDLQTEEGSPFDLRILLQKNEKGLWQETGRAIRTGSQGSITSNLHGGGIVNFAQHYLLNQFTMSQVNDIEQHIQTIVELLPQQLEKEYAPLFELGLDLGVDRQGHVWILEANSKPGRQSIQMGCDRHVFMQSVLAPFRYAQFMSQQLKGAYL